MAIGRLLIGMAGGVYCFSIPIFIGEIASKEIRGFLLTLFQVFVKLGVVFAYTLGSWADLFVLNIVSASLVLIFTISFMFIMETPSFLIRKGQLDKAEKSIKLLRGAAFNAQIEIHDYQESIEKASKAPESSIFAELRKRETIKAFIIICCIFVFFQMSGINAVTFYTITVFIEAGITMDPATATIILGLVQVLSTLATIGIVDRFGRVFLLKISLAMIIVGLTGIGMFFHLKNTESTYFEAVSWLPLTSLCTFVIAFSVGMGPVPFVLLGEIFSSDAKRVIAPIAQTMNFVMSFAIGLSFPALASSIGIELTFFIFAGFSVIGLVFVTCVIPETKGKSLDEIQSLMRE